MADAPVQDGLDLIAVVPRIEPQPGRAGGEPVKVGLQPKNFPSQTCTTSYVQSERVTPRSSTEIFAASIGQYRPSIQATPPGHGGPPAAPATTPAVSHLSGSCWPGTAGVTM